MYVGAIIGTGTAKFAEAFPEGAPGWDRDMQINICCGNIYIRFYMCAAYSMTSKYNSSSI